MCVCRLCDKQLGWFVKRIWWQWNFSNHGFIYLKTENINRLFWRLGHLFQIPQFDSTLLKNGGIINYFQVFGQLLGSRWIAYAWEIWAHQRVSSDFHIICVACPLHCMCNLIEYTPLERWLPIHSPFSCHGSTHPLHSPLSHNHYFMICSHLTICFYFFMLESIITTPSWCPSNFPPAIYRLIGKTS